MSCSHKFVKEQDLCRSAMSIKCPLCEELFVAKPRTAIDINIIPIALNEFLCYRLMELLKSKGVPIKIPKYFLLKSSDSPFGHGVFVMEHYGLHGRASIKTDFTKKNVPSWLYWFDKWIGRIDSAGDTNLLIIGDDAIPVDFSMCFYWAVGGFPNVHSVDSMEIKTLPIIEQMKDDNVRDIIKSITPEEIWNCVCYNIPKEFFYKTHLISYWSGLCFRKKIL